MGGAHGEEDEVSTDSADYIVAAVGLGALATAFAMYLARWIAKGVIAIGFYVALRMGGRRHTDSAELAKRFFLWERWKDLGKSSKVQ